MTLTALRYMITLAQYPHFGQAAEPGNVSQPTLSIAIKKREQASRLYPHQLIP